MGEGRRRRAAAAARWRRARKPVGAGRGARPPAGGAARVPPRSSRPRPSTVAPPGCARQPRRRAWRPRPRPPRACHSPAASAPSPRRRAAHPCCPRAASARALRQRLAPRGPAAPAHARGAGGGTGSGLVDGGPAGGRGGVGWGGVGRGKGSVFLLAPGAKFCNPVHQTGHPLAPRVARWCQELAASSAAARGRETNCGVALVRCGTAPRLGQPVSTQLWQKTHFHANQEYSVSLTSGGVAPRTPLLGARPR
jgi:hypothetical protein